MRARNLCLTTVNSTDEDAHVIDTSDDLVLGIPSVRFGKSEALIPSILTSVFARRREVKLIMKNHDKKSSEYIKANASQMALKTLINTLYGVMGNTRSPLFYMPLAASVTAFARRCTITAKGIIESRDHQFLAADTDSVIV
jgi:DNA polymerase I